MECDYLNGLIKNGHIHKDLTQNGEPQRYSWGTQKEWRRKKRKKDEKQKRKKKLFTNHYLQWINGAIFSRWSLSQRVREKKAKKSSTFTHKKLFACSKDLQCISSPGDLCHDSVWDGNRQGRRSLCVPLLSAEVSGGVLPGGRQSGQGWHDGSLHPLLHLQRRQTAASPSWQYGIRAYRSWLCMGVLDSARWYGYWEET